MIETWIIFMKLAGVAQILLFIASGFIPKCLNWKDGLAGLPLLQRQLFWTYAGYILIVHGFFGLISLVAAEELLAGGILSVSLMTLMALWWITRLVLQFCCFDMSEVPKTKFNAFAKFALTMMFICLSITYVGGLLLCV